MVVLSDGEALTSMSHGLSVSSTMMSYPYSLYGTRQERHRRRWLSSAVRPSCSTQLCFADSAAAHVLC